MLLPTISASYNDDLFLELCPTYKAAILLLCDIYECFYTKVVVLMLLTVTNISYPCVCLH